MPPVSRNIKLQHPAGPHADHELRLLESGRLGRRTSRRALSAPPRTRRPCLTRPRLSSSAHLAHDARAAIAVKDRYKTVKSGFHCCVSFGRRSTSTGSSHSCGTPTSESPAPSAKMISVALGPHGSRGNLQTDGGWGPRVNSTLKRVLFWMVLVVVGVLVWKFSTTFQTHERPVAFSDFMADVDSGKVEQVTIAGHEIAGIYRTDKESFRTYAPSQYDGLAHKLIERGISVTATEPTQSSLTSLLYSWAPILLLIGVLIFFVRQMPRGGNTLLSFGKSKATLWSSSQKKVTFKDVAGVDEASAELQEIIAFLKEPEKFQKLGGRIPKGVLLMGPPGSGKTLLARAVAAEANVPFFSISGSDFVEMFVGVGASRVRDLFEQGKKHAPCIVFIDEIDAVGRHRGAGLGGGHDEREQTLNQLLVEMDGFESNEGVILIAATNRPDVLDPALLRPGRFDRQITVDRPDVRGRAEILKVHTKKVPLSQDVDLAVISRGTPGF